MNKNIAKKEKKRKAERDPIRKKKASAGRTNDTIRPHKTPSLVSISRFLFFFCFDGAKTKDGYKTLALKRKRPKITFSTFDTHKKDEERNRSRLWKQAAAGNRERTD